MNIYLIHCLVSNNNSFALNGLHLTDGIKLARIKKFRCTIVWELPPNEQTANSV